LESTLYLFAMDAHDLLMLIIVALSCWLTTLMIFWIFYGLCALAPGLSMRLGYTFGILLFLICIFFVFRDLKEYFVWWQYTPGRTMAVVADAVLVLAVALLQLLLIWTIWPRPKRSVATL